MPKKPIITPTLRNNEHRGNAQISKEKEDALKEYFLMDEIPFDMYMDESFMHEMEQDMVMNQCMKWNLDENTIPLCPEIM